MLGARPPAAGRERADCRCGRPRHRGRRAGARRPAAVRELGDGRLRRACGRSAGNLAHRRRVGRGHGRSAGSSRPAVRVAISTGAVVPEGADAVVPIENVSKPDNTSGDLWSRSSRARTSALAAATSPRARSWFPPVSGSPPRGWPPPRLRALPSSRACAARASPCSPRAASSSIPAGRSGPGQIYETNSLMLSAALTAAGAEVVAQRPVADDEEALRAGARASGSRPTSSSRRAACRSASTTSSARSSGSSASRRSSGAWR